MESTLGTAPRASSLEVTELIIKFGVKTEGGAADSFGFHLFLSLGISNLGIGMIQQLSMLRPKAEGICQTSQKQLLAVPTPLSSYHSLEGGFGMRCPPALQRESGGIQDFFCVPGKGTDHPEPAVPGGSGGK